jgi:hypothetical protein
MSYHRFHLVCPKFYDELFVLFAVSLTKDSHCLPPDSLPRPITGKTVTASVFLDIFVDRRTTVFARSFIDTTMSVVPTPSAVIDHD